MFYRRTVMVRRCPISAVSVCTRILLFEDDAPPASPGLSSSLDQQFSAKDEQDSDTDLRRPDEAYNVRVLGPFAARQLRALFDHIGELLGMVSERSRPAAGAGEVMRCGNLSLDLRTRTVARGSEQINVSRLEFDLLYALIRRQGLAATRKDLLQEVWGPSARIQPRAVDTHIARLRQKIEETPNHPRYILTAVAVGYRFAPAPEGDVP